MNLELIMHGTIRELRASTKKLMRAVDRGEAVIITSHGKEKTNIKRFQVVSPLFSIKL